MTRTLRALALAPFALLRDLLDAAAEWAETTYADSLNGSDDE